MQQAISAFRATLAVACLAISACGDNGAAGSDALSLNRDTMRVSGTITRPAASASGTRIPTATRIIDGGGNTWTVSAGVVYENGALAGYTNAVTLLLYDNNTIYQENSAGGWWSWSGSGWTSATDPLKPASASGTSIPTVTQLVDGGGNIWTVAAGVIYENGALAGYSSAVTALLYSNNTIYQENSAGGWWSWSGSTWVASSNPLKVASASGTSIPTVKQLVDASGNIWTVSAGVVYKNGVLAGYTNSVTLLLYDNNTIYQENSGGGWWSWNGSGWISSSNPLTGATGGGGSGSTTGTATVSWTAPTENTNGTVLTNIAGYTIYYGTSPSALTKTIQLPNPGATSYMVGNLTVGTYYFTVAAYTTTGAEGQQSTVVSKTIQ
jgi:hypothetical protein